MENIHRRILFSMAIIIFAPFKACAVKECNEFITEPEVVRVIIDSNTGSVGESVIARSKAELKAEFYERALEACHREQEHLKWFFSAIIAIASLFIALVGLWVTYFGVTKTKEIKEEREKAEHNIGIASLWTDGGMYYQIGDYEKSCRIWKTLFEVHGVKSRPFYNNWGSSLLNLAKQKGPEAREYTELLEDAAEKYKRAETYTKGIAAYNLASIYALLNKEDECHQWFIVLKETGRLPNQERVKSDPDFKSIIEKDWFVQLWKQNKTL